MGWGSVGKLSTAAGSPGPHSIPYNPPVAEDKNNEEEKFDFTSEGEGYISLDAAILSARQLVRQDEQHYLSRTGWDEIVWSTSESEAGDAIIKVILQFRRPGREVPAEESGLEEFLFDYNGALQDRQVLSWPDNVRALTSAEFEPTSSPTLSLVPELGLVRWGRKGLSNGEFANPIGVSVAPDGSVYVADTGNDRIQKFSSEGIYITGWGTSGTGYGQLRNPVSVSVASDGSVYVSDRHNHRVQRFTSKGEFITALGTGGSPPAGVATARDNSVYVVIDLYHCIRKLTSSSISFRQWGKSVQYGINDRDFSYPNSVSSASDGSVYVVDLHNRIQKFTSEGVFVTRWGTYGNGNGQFDQPKGVAVGTDGCVYVADTKNDRIQHFTSEGEFICKWGMNGTGDGEFNNPSGVAVTDDGSVYVADTDNHRIQKFTSEEMQKFAVKSELIAEARLYWEVAISYSEDEEYELAIAEFDKAIQLIPENPEMYIDRGMSYYNLCQYQRAIEDYAKAIEFDADNSQVYRCRADVYRSLGQTADADADDAKAQGIEDSSRNHEPPTPT